MRNKNFDRETITKSDEFSKQKNFWLNKLSGDLTVSTFPYDYIKSYENKDKDQNFGYMSNHLKFQLKEEVFHKLISASNQSDSRLFILLVTGLTVLLHKYTGYEDIIVGAPIYRQNITGEFINTILALRNPVSGNMTFKELLLQIKQTVAEALENQNYPLESIPGELKMPGGENDHFPLFRIGQLLENIHDKSYISHLTLDMLISFIKKDECIEGKIEYDSSLYESASIERISKHFSHLLHNGLYNSGEYIAELDVMEETERKYLLEKFNNTWAGYPRDKNTCELFEDQVERTPGSIAVEEVDTGRLITYNQLNRRSNQLARFLMEKGITQETITAVMGERTSDIIASILAIFKAGGVFLPLDGQNPDERIDFILRDSCGHAILSQQHIIENRRAAFREIFPENIIAMDDEDIYGGEAENLLIDISATAPAYIIYTSGTTGKPKGAIIEHQSLSNYIHFAIKSYVKEETMNFPLYTSIAFDLTITSIFVPLVTGNAVIVYRSWDKGNLIERIIEDNKVGVIKLTPSSLHLIGEKKLRNSSSKIRRFVVGGEVLGYQLALDIFDNFNGQVELYNEYGPTEATVGCMLYKFDPLKDRNKGSSVSIGGPASNTQIYLLDKNRRPVPIGVAGEIFIGGDGLARGYLNRSELTKEKFIRFHQSSFIIHHATLYKSGDLARWLTDGTIEFLGRTDHQIKIRGFRVELLEIESKLASHPGIKEAVVLAREDQRGDKYLCAYIVSDREYSAEELGEYLSQGLPTYMIPPYFVRLEKIPLTLNGKIDLKILPDPQEILIKDFVDYIPPKTPIEKKLVETWEQVLGRNNIGINENFFMIGGDSIKSIQIISRMSRAGYMIKMKDLFEYPIISELAPYIEKLKRTPDQFVIIGTIPLTPIQKMFFYRSSSDNSNISNYNHFNQAIMFYSKEGFDEEVIKSVFSKIQAHHDALRMTYEINTENSDVVQIAHGQDYPLSLEEYDLKHTKTGCKELQAKVNQIQGSIDLEKGPLMKLGLFHLDDGDRLLIVIHHLVIDGLSWRILFEDIDTLFGQYTRGEELILPPKTDSFKFWSEKLSAYANSKTFSKEKSYWTELESNLSPVIRKDYKADEKNDYNYVKDTRIVSFTLGEEETECILTKVNRAFRTEINDILLTAMGISIKRTFGHDRILIAFEGHGREEVLEDIDISRTVGWFTSVYPILFNISYENNPGRQIKEIKETLRRIPNKGIGYGILKYLTDKENKGKLEFQLAPQISFNYLGQFDADVNQVSSFEMAKESVGNMQALNNQREYLIDVSGITANNRLTMTISYNETHFKPETIAALAGNFESELRALIAFCCSMKKTEQTPGDFTYKGLSIESIDRLIEQYPDIEDIYTLTPMQEGMLYHALADSSSQSYFEQISYRIEGELKINIVQKSLNELFKRHDILRTAFLNQDIERSVQVVLKERNIDFYYEDITKVNGLEEKENYIKKFKAKDKERSFDLSKDSLMRISIIRMEQGEYEFVWSFHHILMDGWCLGILNNEFFEVYISYLENRTYQLPGVKPYRTYIQWLERYDKEESGRYWESYLDSFEEQTGIPKNKQINKNDKGYKNETVSIQLSKETTTALNKLAGENKVTLNTVTQTIWGILLGKYNMKNDVVFGVVVSGRPSELEGVETMVGLFINAIPVRIRFEERMNFNRLLQQVQNEALASEVFHYHPLAEIQSKTVLKKDLIDHIFIFENYPISVQIEGLGREKNINKISLKLENVEVFEQTNYDFNVVLGGSERLEIAFQYNGNVYEEDFVGRIAKHLSLVIDQVIKNQELAVVELTLLSEEEKARILYEFNGIDTEYPKNKTIHQLFEEQVERTSDNIAVVGPSIEIKAKQESLLYITYKELNKKSNQLALVLIEKGILVDDIVGIMIERSVEMIVGIMGILKSGGAYLPIDPEYPQERINYMLKDSVAKLLVTTDNKGSENVRRLDGEKVLFEEISKLKKTSPYHLNSLICYFQNSSNLVYIMYTSGSSGRPKGVMVEHRNVVNLVCCFGDQYKIFQGTHIVQMYDYTFDPSVSQIFGALTRGACLHIISKMLLSEQELFPRYIEMHRIGLVDFVPRVLHYLLGKSAKLKSAKTVLCGGEKLDDYIKDTFLEYGYELYNHYGPTETTIDVSVARCSLPMPGSIIGHPIRNVSCYIVGKDKNLVPIGVSGELWVAGAGVSRGYLNRPELTAEKFIKQDFVEFKGIPTCRKPINVNFQILNLTPHSQTPIFYKTGDLARWLPDGNMEFLGRIDLQVKIRGVRIELGEIESRLLNYPGIKEAFVIVQEEARQDKYLCAYISSTSEYKISELREYLSKELPDFMIPSHFVKVEKIPLTPNGKVDRKALPQPDLKIGESYAVPRNEIENKLVALWAEILGTDELHTSQLQKTIGIDDNFFELGGHSLKTMTLVLEIHKLFNVKVSLAEMFEIATVRKLSEFIMLKSGGDKYATINFAEKKEYYPLSSVQKRMYIVHLMQVESISYNMPTVVTLEGIIDRERMNNAFQQLVSRHESLRTSFIMIDGRPVQRIYREIEFNIQYLESSGETMQMILVKFLRPFDLSLAPLLRASLIKTDENHSVFVVDMHHIICDGVSHEIMVRDLASLYNGEILPNLKIQYKDFSDWQNRLITSGKMAKQKEYWLNVFGNGDIPVLNMSLDYPRPSIRNVDAGDRVSFSLDSEICKNIFRLTKKINGTLSMILLAALNILLYHDTGQEDIVLGIVNTGRTHADLENVIGMFVNTIPLRNFPQNDKSFGQFLEELKKNQLSAFDNQGYQLDELIIDLGLQGETSRNPLFDVAFILDNIEKTAVKTTDFEIKPYSNQIEFAKFDLALYASEVREIIYLTFRYSTQLFKRSTIEKFKKYYVEILKRTIANVNIKLKNITYSDDYLIPKLKINQDKEDDYKF